MSILGREHFPAALEPDMLDDSDPDANEVSSDEEDLLVDNRVATTARTRGGAKLIKIFSPADHPSLKLTNPYDTEGVIEFIENFGIMARDYPDGDCTMVKCLSAEARNKMLAHGRTMRGNIQHACMSSLGLKALTDGHIKKLLYDMNKAKSPTDMISKVRRITFMKDGSNFDVSGMNMPAFYDQLMLFNSRFLKLVKCYSMRASEDALLSLYKSNGVKGLVDYYLDALPSKSGKAFMEEIVSVKSSIRDCKTIDDFLEKFRRHIQQKRKLALEFRDMGKSLHVRTAEVDSDNKRSSGGNKMTRDHRDQDRKKTFFAQRNAQKVNALTVRDQEEDDDQFGEEHSDEDDEDGDHDEPEQDVSAEFDMDDVYQQMEDVDFVNPMHSEDENMNALDVRSHGRPGGSKPAGASGDARTKPVTPCFVKFLRGKCDNKDCKHSHDDAMMLKVAIGRFKDVAQSKFAPDKEYAKKLLEKAYEEAAKAKPATQGGAVKGNGRA